MVFVATPVQLCTLLCCTTIYGIMVLMTYDACRNNRMAWVLASAYAVFWPLFFVLVLVIACINFLKEKNNDSL